MRNATINGHKERYFFVEINKGEFVSTNRPARDEHDRNQIKQKYEQTQQQRTNKELKAPQKTKNIGGYPEQTIPPETNENGVKVRTEITFRPFKVNEAYLKKRKAEFKDIQRTKKEVYEVKEGKRDV